MKRLKTVIVTTATEGGAFPASTIYKGEQALAEAVAEYYEVDDLDGLIQGISALIVRLQVDDLWAERWHGEESEDGNGR